MILTKEKAIEMLEQAEINNPETGWIKHSRSVGYAASKIAKQLGLDEEKALILGLIHDIGKSVGDFDDHIINGYKYLKDCGYDEEYCNICLIHSFLNNDYICTAAGIPIENEFLMDFVENHEYTIYEKIINLCDLMCTNVVNTIDKRLVDIIVRRGAYQNTQYHIKETYKLKEYFDNLIGFNLYDLFPEIKENI